MCSVRGQPMFPSAVAILLGSVYTGQQAVDLIASNPAGLTYFIETKRLMGANSANKNDRFRDIMNQAVEAMKAGNSSVTYLNGSSTVLMMGEVPLG